MTSNMNTASSENIIAIDFSRFPIDQSLWPSRPLQCVALAVSAFHDHPERTGVVDETLTAFALFVYKAFRFINHSRGVHHSSRTGLALPSKRPDLLKMALHPWRRAYTEEAYFRPELVKVLDGLSMIFFYEMLEQVTVRVDIKAIAQIDPKAKLWDPRIVRILTDAKHWLLTCLGHPGMRACIDSTQLKESQLFAECIQETQQPMIDLNHTVVNNQLSGAGKVEIGLIDFLFKPSSYLYRFNSSPIGLDT
jgi:hypothetical protein